MSECYRFKPEIIAIMKKNMKDAGLKNKTAYLESLIRGHVPPLSERASRSKNNHDLELAKKDNDGLNVKLQNMQLLYDKKSGENDELIKICDRLIEGNLTLIYKIEQINRNRKPDWKPSIKLRCHPRRPIRNRANRRRLARRSWDLSKIWDMKIDDANQPKPDGDKDEPRSSI